MKPTTTLQTWTRPEANIITWNRSQANHGSAGGQDPIDFRSSVESHCGRYMLKSWDVEHGPGRYWKILHKEEGQSFFTYISSRNGKGFAYTLKEAKEMVQKIEDAKEECKDA